MRTGGLSFLIGDVVMTVYYSLKRGLARSGALATVSLQYLPLVAGDVPTRGLDYVTPKTEVTEQDGESGKFESSGMKRDPMSHGMQK